jgi:DNA (cytosine-5)-methyltransferase 1
MQKPRGYNKGGMHEICPTITKNSFEQNNVVAVPVASPDIKNKSQNGLRFKDHDDPQFTLTASDRHGIFDGARIRRLTPIECERLQGFPDNHTSHGNFEGEVKEISDTQRYKCCGNSVTTDVVEVVGIKLLNK